MRYEQHDFDGTGARRTAVYDMAPAPPRIIETADGQRLDAGQEYWPAVTDVPCPAEGCGGTIRWAEAGYVPGYRICDKCGRHFLAGGTATAPTLRRVGNRRG